MEISLQILGYEPYTQVKITERFASKPDLPGLIYVLKPNHSWGIRYPTNPRDYFDDDNTIHIKTNSMGYRDSEFNIEKDPSTLRIALLGDSFAFGYGVRKKDCVADRIEEIMGEITRKNVEVYNFSVLGYSTVEEAILLEYRVLKYHPDIVIVNFCINDPEYRGVLDDIQSDLYKVFPVLRRYSSLFYIFGSRFDSVIPRKKTIDMFRAVYRDEDQRWIECEKSLQKMGHIALKNNIPIYLFFHPLMYGLQGNYLFKDIHRKVIETASRYGLKAYDLLDIFKGRDEYSLWVHPQDMHPNEIAHEIIAEYMTSVIMDESQQEDWD
jgi:lysophospholipase L1-like esterase